MSTIIRTGYGLKLTPAFPALHPDEIGWIPGAPFLTREEAEARRQQSNPDWYEIVPAAMSEDGNVWEVTA